MATGAALMLAFILHPCLHDHWSAANVCCLENGLSVPQGLQKCTVHAKGLLCG